MKNELFFCFFNKKIMSIISYKNYNNFLKKEVDDLSKIIEFIIEKEVEISWFDGKPKIIMNRKEKIFDPKENLKNICINIIISGNKFQNIQK